MLIKKIAVGIFLLFVAAAIACMKGNASRYVIAESKTYEASLFRQNCTICHGPEAEGKTLSDGKVIPNLREGEFKYRSDEDIYRHIAEGGNGMIAFKYQLTPREINMLVGFVQNDLRRK